MPRVSIGYEIVVRINQHVKSGDEHTVFRIFTNITIRVGQHIPRLNAHAGFSPNNISGSTHKEGRGNAFTGNISYENSELITFKREIIVEITTNFFGGLVKGCKAVRMNFQRQGWKNPFLYFGGDINFLGQSSLRFHCLIINGVLICLGDVIGYCRRSPEIKGSEMPVVNLVRKIKYPDNPVLVPKGQGHK